MSGSPAGWPPLGRQVTLQRTPAFSVFSAGGSPASVAGFDRSEHAERNKKGLSPATTAAAADTRSVASARPTPATAGTGAGCSDSSREAGVVCVDVVCPYTRALVLEGLERRRGAWRVTTDSAEASLHWGDYEMIDWERVVSGELRASSYCVRKGLSRKAQLSKYCNKYVSKRPGTLLKGALPRTLVIDTWEAFDDEMTFNLGGDIAAFGSDLGVRQSVSLATRLDWCLGEARGWIDQDEEGQGEEEEATPQGADILNTSGGKKRKRVQRWILKPSTLNKGAGLALGEDFETLREAVHDSPDIREWVLQEYVERPLLAEGRKFHLRAYAMAVGCIQVYLYDTVLLLRAAKQYPVSSSSGGGGGGSSRAFAGEDPLAHITNTARQAEDETFREEDNVWVLNDLVVELERQGRSAEEARCKVDGVMADMRVLTADLFRAFRGEFTVFSPLPGCFEHFGLDFMVDENFHVWLLEANPGPDFKQTGSRLKHVIGGLIEGSMRICLDGMATPSKETTGSDGCVVVEGVAEPEPTARTIPEGGKGFSLVLDEKWRGGTASAPSMKMV